MLRGTCACSSADLAVDAGPAPRAHQAAGAPSSVCPAASQPTGRLTTPRRMAQGCRDGLAVRASGVWPGRFAREDYQSVPWAATADVS